MHRYRLALEENLAVIRGIATAYALDERRLPGAIVADKRGDLSGAGDEVDGLQNVHGSKRFVDAAQLECGRRGGGLRCHWSPAS